MTLLLQTGRLSVFQSAVEVYILYFLLVCSQEDITTESFFRLFTDSVYIIISDNKEISVKH